MADRREAEPGDYAALVRALLDDLAGTSITRLELRLGDLRVGLRRMATGADGVQALVPAAHAGASEGQEHPEHWVRVDAPLTGIFYARPSPDEEPYVHVDSHVEPDQVIGLIETMKMFNEVLADVGGTVRELAAPDGALIEAGQPVIYVEPEDGAQDGAVEAS